MGKFVALATRLERRRLIDPGGCWLWTGTTNNVGYGTITMQTPTGAKSRSVHRVSFEHFVGPIPDGLVIDHLCRVRSCFNPDHLEAVTPRQNVLRSPIAPAAVNARKTCCPSGHVYTPDNLFAIGKGGRQCKACHRNRRSKSERQAS